MFSTPRRRTAGWVLLSVTAAVVILGLVTLLVSTWQIADEVRNTQIEGTPTGKKLVASADRILDCTSPEGQCFKDGQKRTANAVGDINRVIVLAAACSVGLNPEWSVSRRQTAIQTCVIDRLSRQP